MSYSFVKQQKGLLMKKIILSFAAVAVLAGCASYTQYKKNEIYVQDGYDCIVKTGEWGVVNRTNTDKSNSTVYPNTACAELLNKEPAKEPVAKKVVKVEPTTTTIRSVKRVYLRSNCKSSYGTWCE